MAVSDPRPLGDPGPPLGQVAVWGRLTVAALFLWTTVVPLVVGCLLLLPWRRRRLALGSRYARWAGPRLLAILGWTLDVDGMERIDDTPRAIFAINHGSLIDTLGSMSMWPPVGAALGKKSLIWTPGFGQGFVLAGHQLLDRSDHGRAVESVKQLTLDMERLGFTVWLAPEGTRTPDGSLGQFKKGFAHIALATRAPIVPVVFHNAWRLWPHRTFRLTPGVVRVSVLEPIPTDDWAPEALDRHVADVRAVFQSALDRGPSRDRRP